MDITKYIGNNKFMKYLYSRAIVNFFGIAFSNNVALFVRKYVLTHEKFFLYCYRNDVRHYGEYNNLEETNFGIKHSSVSTNLQLSMDNSIVIMSLLSDKHVVKTNGSVMKDNIHNTVLITNMLPMTSLQ